MSIRFTQQTAHEAISKGLGRRFKKCDGKEIFLKNWFFWLWLAKSTGFGFEPEMVSYAKIQC